MSTRIKAAPSSAKSWAEARPIPEAAPVMTATLPASRSKVPLKCVFQFQREPVAAVEPCVLMAAHMLDQPVQ